MVVAFVPVKLNSQRLPHKNVLPLGGHPLCWHVCRCLTEVKDIDRVYVYCSDPEVKKYIPGNVEFLQRPSWLDGDRVKGFDIYQEFIRQVDADIYVLAHTTSPFLRATTVENALGQVVSGQFDSAFSAERIQTFAWHSGKPLNYDLDDVPRTQDIEPVWVETSGFYIFQKEIFTKFNRRIGFHPYIQEVSGAEALDIDEKKDYELACKLMGLEK